MVERVWLDIPRRFRHVELDALVIMPNHIHAILRFREPADGSLERATLGQVLPWWKSTTTTLYAQRVRSHSWPRFDKRLWHRNFYERVIRDDDDLAHAQGYIARNPRRWHEDPENPDATG